MDTFIKQLFQTLRDNDSHISESALARKLGILQYSLNRSISSGSVKLSVFLRALSLMGYTLEIKKEGKTVAAIRPEDYPPTDREKQDK
ncbi:hypothetical protein [uncultured Dialister sp.]|uniref:hypothetical protein n=1 Tax=uncultured Dialister sp. TaxID=278064 RepID=UPI00260AEFF9|nr:hypothetical protein [uncultured Dialister sp.]